MGAPGESRTLDPGGLLEEDSLEEDEYQHPLAQSQLDRDPVIPPMTARDPEFPIVRPRIARDT
jgi:hypothetical protein